MHLLIVEGDACALAPRAAAFAGAGHHVVATPGTTGALSQLRRHRFDLVLLDPFCERDWNFAMLALARISAPTCRIVLLTSSRLFPRGELFQMTPQNIDIIRAPIPARDLVVLCEERCQGPGAPHDPACTVRKTQNGGAREEGTAVPSIAHRIGRSGAQTGGATAP